MWRVMSESCGECADFCLVKIDSPKGIVYSG
jgi:hypothetical protein